jgi:hypothetical protein
MQSDQRLWSVGYFFAGAASREKSAERGPRSSSKILPARWRLRQLSVVCRESRQCSVTRIRKEKIAPSQPDRSASRHSPEIGGRNDSSVRNACPRMSLLRTGAVMEQSLQYATGHFVSNCHFCFTSSPSRSKIDPWSGLHLKH